MATTGNKPIRVFRARGVKVSVFQNQSTSSEKDFTFHKVTVQKIFRDGNEYKSTFSLGRDDLPVACLLLQRAWECILDTEANGSKEQSDHE